mgnify:CR=1 FL=1
MTSIFNFVCAKFEQVRGSKFQNAQILLKFGADMSFGSSKLQEKFKLNSSIKTSVMTDFVFCLVMKKIKNGPYSKKTPRLLDPMPPVGIIGGLQVFTV